jgi:hypothetical protein
VVKQSFLRQTLVLELAFLGNFPKNKKSINKKDV